MVIGRLPEEALEPLPTQVLNDAGVLDWGSGTRAAARDKEVAEEVVELVSDNLAVLDSGH